MPDSPSAPLPRGHLWLGAAILVLTLLASLWFVQFVGHLGHRLEHDRVLALARTVTATLESEPIAALHGDGSDIGSASFDAVRGELRRARDVNPDFRFVYLMRPATADPQKMLFLADAEAPESPDYSAPGDVYDGPSDDLFQVWHSGRPLVQPVHTDNWGQWITAIAPVHTADGGIVAILGMDIRADSWNATLARYRLFAIAIAGLVLLLELLFLLGLHQQKKAGRRLAALNRTLATQLEELQRAQAGLRLADAVVRHTGEAIVVVDPELRVLRANPGFTRITGFAAEAVQGRVLPLFGHDDGDTLQQIHSRMQLASHWDGTLWARRANGESFPMEVSIDLISDEQANARQHVMVFRDVTVQKRLEDRLRELSATDGLTLVANRRHFDEALEQAWRDATRSAKPVSLLMIDIDHFKPYNDLYGHPAGDRCLQQVAGELATAVADQPGALVARYGGEEFAVILPHMDETAATAVAESLRQRIHALDIAHRGNPDAGRITISIGISSRTPPQTTDFEDLMSSADQALYRAKRTGRNAVAAAG